MTSNPSLDCLSDDVLLCQFGALVQQDRRRTATLLRHIDAIDRRQLWAKRGHPSMFDFCVARYNMSESTAGKRIGAARTARRFPVLFEMVARGDIHLSGIHRLKAHLTPDNHAQVLAEAERKTIRQIEQLVARLAPKADVPSTLRALPRRPETSAVASMVPAVSVATELVAAAPEPTKPAPAPMTLPVPRRAPDPVPLAPGRYKLQVTLSENARDTLKQLQDLLAHQIPSGDPAAIVERALGALLSQVHKRKTGITEKPRASRPRGARRTRSIPAALRREVWPRDQGRCSFVGEDGHRCNETRCLEFAHLYPWGKDGEHSASNDGVLREHAYAAAAGCGLCGHQRQEGDSDAAEHESKSDAQVVRSQLAGDGQGARFAGASKLPLRAVVGDVHSDAHMVVQVRKPARTPGTGRSTLRDVRGCRVRRRVTAAATDSAIVDRAAQHRIPSARRPRSRRNSCDRDGSNGGTRATSARR